MQTTPAYVGWGTHEFDENAVFLVNLPKDPGVYAHEFYIGQDEAGNDRLHHRMIDTEVDEAAFTHAFKDEDAEALLTLLIDRRKYWIGFTDVEGDGIEDNVTMYDGQPSPDDGLFKQQHVHDTAYRELVKIAKSLYVPEA